MLGNPFSHPLLVGFPSHAFKETTPQARAWYSPGNALHHFSFNSSTVIAGLTKLTSTESFTRLLSLIRKGSPP